MTTKLNTGDGVKLPEAEAGRGSSPTLASELVAVFAFCAFLFFFGLGSFGLVGADEPRYAQIAREMLERGDWVVPVLNGEPWLEKPVLYYWGAMLSYSVFGVHDWAARVPTALLASLMIVGIYAFARKFRRGSQLDAALITASAAAVLGFARGASTDMPLTATFTLAMLAWYTWFQTERRLWLACFYGTLALATLAKGPVAPALGGAVLILFALLRREAALVRRTIWLPGVLLFLAIALPWYVLVELRTGEFFRVFVLEHTVLRFGTNLFRHKQPIWYYAPVLVLSLLPWTVLAITAAGEAFAGTWRRAREAWRSKKPSPDGMQLDDLLPEFLALWLAVPLMVFSISQSKLPGYILPGIPAATLLTAHFVWNLRRREQRLGLVVILLHALTCGVLLAAALLSPSLIMKSPPRGLALAVAIGAGVLVAGGVAASLRLQGGRVLRFVTLVPVVVGLAFVIRIASGPLDMAESARPVSVALSQLETERGTLALFRTRREVEYGLSFYRNQAIRSYDRGEVPAEDHLLVSRAGSLPELEAMLPGRRFSPVGGFERQGLEFYWVSTAGEHDGHAGHGEPAGEHHH